MQSCPAPLWPATQACGNGGTCLSDSLCQCADGWVGEGDFVYASPSCSINVAAITALYSITAVVNAIPAVGALYFLWALRRKAKSLKLVFAFTCLVGTSSLVILSIIRASSPQTTAIGTYVPSTVLFSIGSGGFWFGGLLFLHSFLSVASSQVRFKPNARTSFARIQAQLRIGFPLIFLGVAVALLCVLCMLAAQSASSMYALALVHYVLLGLSMLSLGAFLIPMLINPLILDLSESLSMGADTSKIRQILSKLTRFKSELRSQNLLNFPVAIMFGCWPWLQMQSSFFLPLAYISTAVLTALALYIEFPVSSPSSSSLKTKSEGNTGTGTSGHVSVPHHQSVAVSSPRHDEGSEA
jgi:hypothetical protein